MGIETKDLHPRRERAGQFFTQRTADPPSEPFSEKRPSAPAEIPRLVPAEETVAESSWVGELCCVVAILAGFAAIAYFWGLVATIVLLTAAGATLVAGALWIMNNTR